MSYNVAMKTVFKMLDIPLDGKISREDFEKYSKHERDGVKLLNPAEAEKVYSGLMSISDVLGLPGQACKRWRNELHFKRVRHRTKNCFPKGIA